MIIQRIPVYLKSVILAMLAHIHERLVGVLCQRSLEIDPAATGRADDLDAYGRITTQ